MANDIVLKFIKTNHFKQRQVERQVSDTLLVRVLSCIKSELQDAALCVVVSEKRLSEWRYCTTTDSHAKRAHNLVIAMANRVLITLYFCNDLKRFMHKHSRKEKFVIV